MTHGSTQRYLVPPSAPCHPQTTGLGSPLSFANDTARTATGHHTKQYRSRASINSFERPPNTQLHHVPSGKGRGSYCNRDPAPSSHFVVLAEVALLEQQQITRRSHIFDLQRQLLTVLDLPRSGVRQEMLDHTLRQRAALKTEYKETAASIGNILSRR